MQLPPKGDPRRPMHLAIRSCQLLGFLFIIFSMLVGAAFLVGSRGPASWVLIFTFLVLAVPGILYVLVAVFVRRHQAWAVVLGLVVASLNELLVLFSLVGQLLNPTQSPIVLIVTLLWAVALGQLIYQLAVSPAAMRADQAHQPRGFDVLPVARPFDENNVQR